MRAPLPPLLLLLLSLPRIALGTAPPAWVRELRESNCASATVDIQEMYEDLPYPHRDPADEVQGQPFGVDAASTPAAISHHVYGGEMDFAALRRPFRILVAGGGTGDATVMAAVSFHAAGLSAEIVHADLSAASIEVARRRVEVHNVSESVKVTFHHGSFLELKAEDVGGPFDFVNSVGVVHHLASPAGALRKLRGLLRPGGGLFLMVYGELGRTGVYDVQDMWHLSGLSRRQFLDGPLQALLQQLPDGNRLRLNRRMMGAKVRQGDLNTISDLLANPCDHAYTVASLLELLAEADLELQDFADSDRYEVPKASRKAAAPLLAGMADRFQRAHFAELLRGDLFIHSFWALPGPTPAREPVPQITLDSVLCPAWRFVGYRLELRAEDVERCLRDSFPADALAPGQVPQTCQIYLDQQSHEGLPCLAVPMLEQLDCERTVGQLHAALAERIAAVRPGEVLSAAQGLRLAKGLFDGISTEGQRKLFLTRHGLPFRRPPWREKKVSQVIVKRDWDAMYAASDGDEGAGRASEL